VANHVSNLDPPVVVTAIPRRVALLGKKEVFRVPLLGRALLLAQMVPVDRADPGAARGSVERALENLQAGVSYLTFPEGTRSPDGRMQPFKKGSFVMAIRAGVPIVPVSVIGAHLRMPKGSLALRPGEVGVRFGEPIQVHGYSEKDRDALLRLVHAAVAKYLPEDQQPLKSGLA
jgi:1-acyl-sn-glycerol-3-phosphate acyltransferase